MRPIHKSLLPTVIIAIALAMCVSAQDSRPKFEVASIKRSPADAAPPGINRTAGQFTTSNLSLPFLIRWAYDLDEDRLIGVPKGLDTAKFDIVAKIPQGERLMPGALRLMMQNLLIDRFHLKVHSETRELSLYALMTDKDGPKVHFVDASQPVGMNPFNMTDRGRIVGTRVTAEMLAKVLADQLKRPVQDVTGISMPFDFVLEWMPDTTTDQDEAVGGGSARASIFTALREQLGFRLNSRKSAIEVIAIDYVDKVPSEN